MKRSLVLLAAAAGACGCGDPLVNGSYLGNATLRLNGLLSASVGNRRHPAIGRVDRIFGIG